MELESIHFIHMAISAAIFLLLWRFVGQGMAKPFFQLIEDREARTIGDEQKARETKALSERITSDIELELHDSRIEGVKHREEQLSLAKEEAGKVLLKAEKEVEVKLEAGRAEIESLSDKARVELNSQVDDLADILYAQVVGKGSSAKEPTVH